MIKAFSEVSRTIQGIKVRTPKPTVSGKLIGKHSSDGFKLGLEKPFEKLPGVASSIMSEALGTHLFREIAYRNRKATATFLVTNEDKTLGEVVGRATYENFKIESSEDFEREAIEHFVWCQARFKADCYNMTIEC